MTEAVGLVTEEEAVQTPPAGAGEPDNLGYQVRLETFSGPLDLLLYLVRRAEVDVTDIPVATIADQYLDAIGSWEEADLEVAGDFILMAATLLAIKARLVAPAEADDDEEEEDETFVDPRAELIEHLLAFRRVKEHVQLLADLEMRQARCRGRRSVEVIPEDPELEAGYDLENAEPYQLFLAWDRIQRTIAGQRPRTVFYDDVPMEERRREIVELVRSKGSADLAWLLEREGDRLKRAGVVLALLECIRTRELTAVQHEQYGPVHLCYLDEAERRGPVASGAAEPAASDLPPHRRPLVTAPAATIHDLSIADGLDAEVFAETDEQRFVRELNAETGIDGILRSAADLDAGLREHLAARGLLDEDEEDGEDDVDSAGPEATRPAPPRATAPCPEDRPG